MVTFTWIVLGAAGVLFLISAGCWGIFLAADSPDWKKLATKIFRIGLVAVLFFINVYVYVNVFRAATGQPPAPSALESTEE